MWVFLQVVVKDEKVTERSQTEVQDSGAQVGENQQTQDLSQRPVLGPGPRVHVRREDIVVGDVQHQIHGRTCDQSEILNPVRPFTELTVSFSSLISQNAPH